MQTQDEKVVTGTIIQRPAIYKVERYTRTKGLNAARLFREKALPYYKKMPGIKSVRAFQTRFGFGSASHDLEIWLELENMACLDAWEEYVISNQEEILTFEAEWDQTFENRGSRLMGDWPDFRWISSE